MAQQTDQQKTTYIVCACKQCISAWMRVCMLYIMSLNIYYLWHSLYVNQLLVQLPFNYNLIIWYIQFCIIFVHLKVSF